MASCGFARLAPAGVVVAAQGNFPAGPGAVIQIREMQHRMHACAGGAVVIISFDGDGVAAVHARRKLEQPFA